MLLEFDDDDRRAIVRSFDLLNFGLVEGGIWRKAVDWIPSAILALWSVQRLVRVHRREQLESRSGRHDVDGRQLRMWGIVVWIPAPRNRETNDRILLK